MTPIEHLTRLASVGVDDRVEKFRMSCPGRRSWWSDSHFLHFDDAAWFRFRTERTWESVNRADFEIVRDYVRSTHFHDNTRDAITICFQGGTIDWKRAMKVLRPRRTFRPCC